MIGTVGSFSHASQIHVDWFAFKAIHFFWSTPGILDSECWNFPFHIMLMDDKIQDWFVGFSHGMLEPSPLKKATKTAVFVCFFFWGGCRLDSPLPRKKSSFDKFDKKRGVSSNTHGSQSSTRYHNTFIELDFRSNPMLASRHFEWESYRPFRWFWSDLRVMPMCFLLIFFDFGGYGVVFLFALRTRIEGLFVHIFYYYDHSVTHTHTKKRRNNNIYAFEKISIG